MTFQKAFRYKHKSGVMNKTEQEYAAHLAHLQKQGEIESFDFEVETLKLGQDCRYTPDFRILRPQEITINAKWIPNTIEFHEVKGTRYAKKGSLAASKPFVEDDALVKIKVAAKQHPYLFVLVWKNGQKWEQREI